MFVDLSKLASFILWIAGVVIAKGFWSTFFAVVIPPYAWYLAVESLLQVWGVI
ncbi:hypothetical protein [Salinicola sp. CR57]|uniref:hypothetical protein n=1 Tax=Salinicola sp. CR57 TaxID=1949086 RepID=UPI0018E57C32|nr:hypothetical protein [Salinicola sp. CR57]